MTRKKRIYLSPPHMGGTELDFIHEAFETNWIAPLGKNVDEFEADLASFTGVKHAAALTTGTAAIHLGLQLLGVKEGDEVICQSFTFAASVNPVTYLKATPVLVDSEPETWNMDPDLLEEAIRDRIRKGKKPKAIIVVHLYGMPAKMPEIQKIAGDYEIPVLEDAAEALGSSIHGKMCGSFGKLAVLSFNGNKIITTSGGGALIGNDEKMIEKARYLATQARDKAPHYQHSEAGYNYRMSNILAGIGRGQMQVIKDRVEARRKNFDFYFERLGRSWIGKSSSTGESSTGICFLKEPESYFSNRWLSAILVYSERTGGVTKEDLRSALEKENIESRPLWKPMHLQPVYKNAPFYGSGTSETLFDKGLCLPSGSELSVADKERITEVIIKMLPQK
ncbi:MAG: aminotransferase class I/II-fold pyridoxal phosphate-dependent enzyme [Balneolaceae bacterium]